MTKLKIASLTKTGYELGQQFANLFDINLVPKFKYYEELLQDDRISTNLKIVKTKLQNIYPEYLNEIYGRADGFNINRDAYLLQICFEIYDFKQACTDIIIKKDNGEILLGHNEDIEESLEEIALVKYTKNDDYFYELSSCYSPEGTTFGWNSKGLIFTVNSIALNEYNEQGIPAWLILRDIVLCDNIEEVINKIDIQDCASAFSLNIVDTKTNKAYSIEKILDKLDLIEIKKEYIHTNHIIHPNLNEKLCYTYDSTIIRKTTAKKLLNTYNKSTINPNELMEILQYHHQDEYVIIPIGEDEEPTVATFLYDSKNNKIKIYSYYDNQIIEFNIK